MSTAVTARSSIQSIIESRKTVTHFQPILSARQREVVGLEALTRGASETGTVIPHASLYKLAADLGLAMELDRVCLERAMEAFSGLPDRPRDLLLFLNLAPSVQADPVQAVAAFDRMVRETGLRPSQVAIEILESRLPDLGHMREFVDVCRSSGFLMVLDDVGAGHSNLDRVPLIKPDVLKVDRSLIARIDADYHRQETLKSLVGLSRRIGALVVAEGVETEAEAIVSLELGADLLQGYFLGQPTPVDSGGLALAEWTERIASLAGRFREHMVRRIIDRRTEFQQHGVVMDTMLGHLTNAPLESFDAILAREMARHPTVECAYVLDEAGIQVTDTVCHETIKRRGDSAIFHPAPRGADHSLKEYYYVLVSVDLQKYTTDPYVSLASGNICRTISTYFEANGRRLVLCIDLLSG